MKYIRLNLHYLLEKLFGIYFNNEIYQLVDHLFVHRIKKKTEIFGYIGVGRQHNVKD